MLGGATYHGGEAFMAAANSHEQALEPSSNANLFAERRPRLWPAFLLLALFFTIYKSFDWLELSMGNRFVYRMLNYAVLLLLFLIWWFAASRVRWSDRLFAFGVAVSSGIAAGYLADKTV